MGRSCAVGERRSERLFAFLFATAALLLIKISAFSDFSLLTDIERRNRTMVAHHPGPDFARSSFTVFNPVFF